MKTASAELIHSIRYRTRYVASATRGRCKASTEVILHELVLQKLQLFNALIYNNENFDLSTCWTKVANWFCSSIGGRYILNFSKNGV